VLAHPGLDAIGMAVGPAAHVEMGLAALGRGLPVFMEKPPGASAADAERLLEGAERSRQPVVVGFMKRYSIGNRPGRSWDHRHRTHDPSCRTLWKQLDLPPRAIDRRIATPRSFRSQ
jgi:hypothetical protein